MLLVVAGCSEPDLPAGTAAPTANVTAAPSHVGPKVDNIPLPTDAPSPTFFDVQKAPSSTELVSAFPHVDNAAVPERARAEVADVSDRTVPIWTGDRVLSITGKVHQQAFRTNADGQFTTAEAQKFVTDFVTKAGGTLVTESYLPDAAAAAFQTADPKDELVLGLGDVYNQPLRTYLIKSGDKVVWVHSVSNVSQTSLLVVEAPAQ